MKVLSVLGTGYFLKSAKINCRQEKPICFYHKNQFQQNTKNRQSAKINSCKNFLPHSNTEGYEPREVNSWLSLVTYCPNKQRWGKFFAGSQVSKAKNQCMAQSQRLTGRICDWIFGCVPKNSCAIAPVRRKTQSTVRLTYFRLYLRTRTRKTVYV